jgi:hypothetical protein
VYARGSLVRPPQQRLYPLVIHHLGAVDLRLESTKHSVSTMMCRLRPLTFLPPSKPRSSPPTALVFTDWPSTTPALWAGDLCPSEPATVRGWSG